LFVELRIFVSFRFLPRRISDLSHTLLSSGANKISLHIVDTPLWIDKVLPTFALNLNLAANHIINHVYRLFIGVRLIFLVDSFSSLNRIILPNLIRLNLLDCLVIVVLNFDFLLVIDTHLVAMLSRSLKIRV